MGIRCLYMFYDSAIHEIYGFLTNILRSKCIIGIRWLPPEKKTVYRQVTTKLQEIIARDLHENCSTCRRSLTRSFRGK